MSNRVVITGLGVVSSLGMEIDKFWNNIVNGQSGISKIESFDTEEYPSKIGAEIKEFDPNEYIDRKDAKRMAVFTQYAVVAAIKALQDAGLEVTDDIANEVGVLIGSGIGGIEVFEKQIGRLVNRGPKRISPFFIPMMISNMAAGQVAIYANAKGPNSNEVTACASGTHSIGEAMEIIKRGDAKVMIAGGSEASVTPSAVAGFSNMKALSTRNDEPQKASRPFDKERDGFVIGEGSGIVVLEDYEFAKKRGANIIAEVSGYGMSADAYHMTQPAPNGAGAYRAMEMAVNKANCSYDDIGYINAHGTSTPFNDKLETQAIKDLFESHADELAVSSTKSMTGHLLGAAGGIEAVISTLALRDDVLPPTINYENEDPECDLDYVPNEAREVKNLKAVLSNSFGFGGQNACIVLNKVD
ncbi:MAG: beta-ketoacyl-ACP synthase II [Halanaerobiales bacterium]|nr:beta-ketoacyl-ACP synthase II [Halanaerobiales bacterium]